MELLQLLNSLPRCEVFGDPDVEIKGVCDHSGKVKKGFLFCAISGARVDGHDFIEQAIKAGAVAVVGHKDFNPKWGICYIKVPDSRLALSFISSGWYGKPSEKLIMIGVTGTKGKTTTASLIYSIFSHRNLKVGVITSNSALIGKKKVDTGFHVTNPEPLLLHSLLRKMVDSGIRYCVLEVTSHGLDQERVASINFDTAVITNISHEHLDYHGDMQTYIKAKLKLFSDVNNAVLNLDDREYKTFRKQSRAKRYFTYSLSDKSADCYLTDYGEKEGFRKFEINSNKRNYLFETPFLGNFNLPNIAAAITVASVYNLDWNEISKAMRVFRGVEGRLEYINNNKGLKIVIDFAHTPDSLEKILSYLKQNTDNRLICVFGCASERDTLKRPIMGNISTTIADVSVFTAEDPRRENATSIIADIEEGVDKNLVKSCEPGRDTAVGKHTYYKIPDRGEAISFAVNKIAHTGDIVVICGKGHEKSMNYGGIEYPWNDKKAVGMALKGKILKINNGNQ